MIIRNSKFHQKAINLLASIQNETDFKKFKRLIENTEYTYQDGFLTLLDYGIENKPFKSFFSKTSLNDWLLNIKDWLNSILNATYESTLGEQIIYCLWEDFEKRLSNNIRRSRLNSSIPFSGGILSFVGALSKCIVFNYDIIGDTPRLRIISVLDNPKSAFDFWEAIDHADPNSRNSLKSILSSGHKLISHRGVLVHVDRRTDQNVFGPSIDTLVLSEILAQDIFESDHFKPKIVLEIGSGNGLLSAETVAHCRTLREIFCIDINFNAVCCTARNVFSVVKSSNLNDNSSIYLINGDFKKDLFSRKFDLIICNPPYIPLPPNLGMESFSESKYYEAVAGTNLIERIIFNLADLLSTDGKLLLMTSNLTLSQILHKIPKGIEVSRPLGENGYEVLFDVESVLNKQEWLNFLLKKCHLRFENGMYFHDLHPLWLTVRR